MISQTNHPDDDKDFNDISDRSDMSDGAERADISDNQNPTKSGESLDEVLSSIRETVTSHVEGRSSSLALAFDELREEITQLRKKFENEAQPTPLSSERLEVMIAQMARPMLDLLLKDWVEKHLPPLAEQVVREEIEKLSRKIK